MSTTFQIDTNYSTTQSADTNSSDVVNRKQDYSIQVPDELMLLIFSYFKVRSLAICCLVKKKWQVLTTYGAPLETFIKANKKLGYIDAKTKNELDDRYDRYNKRVNRLDLTDDEVKDWVCSVHHAELNRKIRQLRLLKNLGQSFSSKIIKQIFGSSINSFNPLDLSMLNRTMKQLVQLENFGGSPLGEIMTKIFASFVNNADPYILTMRASMMLSRIGLEEKIAIDSIINTQSIKDERNLVVIQETIEEYILDSDFDRILEAYDILLKSLVENKINLFEDKYKIFYELAKEIAEIILHQKRFQTLTDFIEKFSSINSNGELNSLLEGLANCCLRKLWQIANKEVGIKYLTERLSSHCGHLEEATLVVALRTKEIRDEIIISLLDKIDFVENIETFLFWERGSEIVEMLKEKFISDVDIDINFVIDDISVSDEHIIKILPRAFILDLPDLLQSQRSFDFKDYVIKLYSYIEPEDVVKCLNIPNLDKKWVEILIEKCGYLDEASLLEALRSKEITDIMIISLLDKIGSIQNMETFFGWTRSLTIVDKLKEKFVSQLDLDISFLIGDPDISDTFFLQILPNEFRIDLLYLLQSSRSVTLKEFILGLFSSLEAEYVINYLQSPDLDNKWVPILIEKCEPLDEATLSEALRSKEITDKMIMLLLDKIDSITSLEIFLGWARSSDIVNKLKKKIVLLE